MSVLPAVLVEAFSRELAALDLSRRWREPLTYTAVDRLDRENDPEIALDDGVLLATALWEELVLDEQELADQERALSELRARLAGSRQEVPPPSSRLARAARRLRERLLGWGGR